MASAPGRVHSLPLWLLLALLPLSGCGHEEPFASRYRPEENPFGTLEPVRLTRSPGEDQFPSWTPDGTGILYSFVDPITIDRCLGQLPAGGGQVTVQRCPEDDPTNDSLDLAIEPMMRGDGLTAWVQLHGGRELQIHSGGTLWVAPFNPLSPPRPVWHFPYLASTGAAHFGATNLRWMKADRLAYVGIDYLIRAICFGCKPDTVVIARDAMLLDLAEANPVPFAIPGMAEATSIWPTADSTGLYYTLAGDTRVWSRGVDSGPPSVVHDFGSAGIVRDVSVAGQRLVAVVGGKVDYGFEESIGLRQIDSGGTLMMVDLATGEETAINQLLHRRAVISPDGHRLVAERAVPPSGHPDLYLFRLP